MKKVLIPIDWSENAEHAFDWYVYHLHIKGTTLILTHFIEASKQKELQEKEEKMRELQEVYENRLLQLRIDYTWLTVSGGTAGEQIVRLANENEVEMIVMGARGLGKIKKTILGSVSDYVIQKAKAPVLVCKMSS